MTDSADLNAALSSQPQASALPYRIGETGLEFCLITTRRSGRWSFPKGCLREHETIESAALSEALEEAGVTGAVVGEPLGNYTYRKRGGHFSVSVVLMEVTDSRQRWKEGSQRKRCWASFHRAIDMLDRPNLTQLLEVAMRRLTDDTGESSIDTQNRASA